MMFEIPNCYQIVDGDIMIMNCTQIAFELCHVNDAYVVRENKAKKGRLWDIIATGLFFSVILERNNDYSDTLHFSRWWVGEVGMVTFLVLEVPDYKSCYVNILIYLYKTWSTKRAPCVKKIFRDKSWLRCTKGSFSLAVSFFVFFCSMSFRKLKCWFCAKYYCIFRDKSW